ncbi:MAG TPA: hypothetical protein VFG91_07765 [Woeseiaceae bacterium]|nr:hypothetical protein [Woeseiaceae bacterium]
MFFLRRIPKSIVVAAAGCLAAGGALAHIKNEASQFPDIEFSDARYDIVVLVGAGIIPQTPVFEPDSPLSRHDLAAWVALARGLGSGGETPDMDALADAALEHGAVESLDGLTTYAELNALFFGGRLTLEESDQTPSRGEAASFIAEHLDTEAGRALLASLDLRTGATGTVTAVRSERGEEHGAYVIAVGDTALPMYLHGRVANGPVDLLQWKDRKIRRSFVRDTEHGPMWIYLEAEPRVETAAMPAIAGTPQAADGPPPVNRKLMYWLVAAVVVLGLALFLRRRRTH